MRSPLCTALWLACVQLFACAPSSQRARAPQLPAGHAAVGSAAPAAGFTQRGKASYYGRELAGRPTASGERFDPEGLTAAHRTLPFGTWLRVRALRSGREVTVRVNDRGPFGKKTRIVDLSLGAARKLQMLRAGVIEVELQVLPQVPR